MAFTKWLFRMAGIFGLVVLVPQYFMENHRNLSNPPPIAHPEYFYGFIGVAVAWQFGFLLISTDPARYRLFMLPAVLEKLTFSIVTLILFSQHRATGELLGFGLIDLCLGILFLVAFLRTQPANEPTS